MHKSERDLTRLKICFIFLVRFAIKVKTLFSFFKKKTRSAPTKTPLNRIKLTNLTTLRE